MNALTKFDNQKLDTLRRHFGKELSLEELELFGLICERTQLDPYIKQIFPVKRKTKQSDGSYREVMVIQVAIDGLRSIAERTSCYAPGREPHFVYDEKKNIISATAYIKKMTADGTWHDVSATAFMNEYRPKYGNFWDNMPHLMLAKCAEALAIRKAFPAQTSRVYTPEEMSQAHESIDITPKGDCAPENKIAHSSPNEGHSEQTELSAIGQLKMHLALDHIPVSRLEDWLRMRAQMKNETEENIAKLCLDEKFLPKFKESFCKFIAPENSEALAV